MPKSSTPKWPSYTVGPDTHMHALGVISVNYNGLELALDRLLREYLGASHEAHAYIFESLNLNSQGVLFKVAIKREKHEELRQHLLDFCAYFQLCAANRNLLLHANLHEGNTDDNLLGLSKRSKKSPHIFNDMQLDLSELRRTADEMRSVFDYAVALWAFINARKRDLPLPSLPGKPAQPTSLDQKLQPDRKKP